MVTSYCLYGQDNDSWMLDDGKPSDGLRCPKCGLLTDFNYSNPFYKLKKSTYDYSHPYDIGIIVSTKFKEFCVRENYSNIEFKELERSPGFFQFYAKRILKVDAQRSGTTFSKYCDVCKNYEEVIGSNPLYLQTNSKVDEGFYRTDLIFGSRNGKNPIIIIDPSLQQKLKREKLKGLVFRHIVV